MATAIYFSSPTIKDIKLVENKLKIVLDWGDEIGTSIISRNVNGYNYQDIEYEFERFFESPEFLIYEYNLPISVDILKSLPITAEANKIFKPSAKMHEDINKLKSKF